jgi:hypothetical protein
MFQLNWIKGNVIGDCGECYDFDYFDNPTVKGEIKGDLTGEWNPVEFVLDTGAHRAIIHSEYAVKYGLNINDYDYEGAMGTLSGPVKIYYKKAVLIKISNFPAIPITIGFSPFVTKDHLILGRRPLLSYFSWVFHNEKFAIFKNK